MNYLTTSEFAKKYNITNRMAAYYCQKGDIPGVIKKGKTWLIPDYAQKPIKKQKTTTTKIDNSVSPIQDGDVNAVDIMNVRNRYRIQDIHEFLGVTREGIRYYEKLGLIQPPREDENNYRMFDGYDILRLMAIDFYHKRGFTNREISHFLKISKAQDLLNPISEKENELIDIINEYQKMLYKLNQTKSYIESLENCLEVFSIQSLPNITIKSTFPSFSAFYEYQEKVLNAKDFSNEDILSSMLRMLYFNESGYTGSQMCIVERESAAIANIPSIYIRVSADNNDETLSDTMLRKCRAWAKVNGLALKGEVYIFIRLVLFGSSVEHSFYDVYVPIE